MFEGLQALQLNLDGSSIPIQWQEGKDPMVEANIIHIVNTSTDTCLLSNKTRPTEMIIQ